MEIRTDGSEDIREELFFAFAQAKCPILTLKKTEVSLEQVFLELTEGEGTNASEEEAAQEEMETSDEDVTEGGESDESDL